MKPWIFLGMGWTLKIELVRFFHRIIVGSNTNKSLRYPVKVCARVNHIPILLNLQLYYQRACWLYPLILLHYFASWQLTNCLPTFLGQTNIELLSRNQRHSKKLAPAAMSSMHTIEIWEFYFELIERRRILIWLCTNNSPVMSAPPCTKSFPTIGVMRWPFRGDGELPETAEERLLHLMLLRLYACKSPRKPGHKWWSAGRMLCIVNVIIHFRLKDCKLIIRYYCCKECQGSLHEHRARCQEQQSHGSVWEKEECQQLGWKGLSSSWWQDHRRANHWGILQIHAWK